MVVGYDDKKTITKFPFSNPFLDNFPLFFQPEMILHEGYPVETHTVRTEDCYILKMHRIPYGKSLSSVRFQNKPRPVVLLQHGILCSSADWVMGHSDDSLGKDDTKLIS